MRFFMGLAAAVVLAGAAAAQDQTPVEVHFEHRSAASTDASLEAFNVLASQLRQRTGDYYLTLYPFADTSEGDVESRRLLAERRAATVRAAMVARGVPRDRIISMELWSPLGPTAAENRRVRITVDAGTGW
jgi:outer membrane protein OmpA-like peptidoglycan-associated protein